MDFLISKLKKIYIFYIGYFLLLVTDMCKEIKVVNTYQIYITLIGYALIGLYLLLNIKKFWYLELKYKIIAIIGFIITTICFYFSRNYTTYRLYFLCLALMTMDFDPFVKTDVTFKITLIVLLMLLSIFNVIDLKYVLRASTMERRYSFGFGHPNTLSMYLCLITFEISYLLLRNKEEIKKKAKICLTIFIPFVCFFVYYVTDSKTSVFILLIFYCFVLMYLYCYKFLEKLLKLKFIRFCLRHMFLIISLIVIGTVLVSYININALDLLDKIFSERYSYYLFYLKNLDVSFLGTSTPVDILGVYLDNMYVKLFINFGLLFCLMYYVLFYQSTRRSLVKENYILSICLCAMCFVGFVETNTLVPTVNIFVLYCFSRIALDNQIKKKIKGDTNE